MNFVAQVEEHLRDLGTEARKKHPGVNEASERAILQLRSLQNEYVGAVRRATSTGGKHPTTSIFASQDVLRPFLLACNYPDASAHILDIALEGMQQLLDGHAICADDGVHIGRVLSIQAHVVFSTLYQQLQQQSQHQSIPPPILILSTPNYYEENNSIALEEMNQHHNWNSHTGIGSHTVRSTNWKEEEHIALQLMHTVRLLVNSTTVALTEEVLQTCLSVCMILAHVGGNIPPASNNNGNHQYARCLATIYKIRPVATATIRQILNSLYRRTFRVNEESNNNNNNNNNNNKSLSSKQEVTSNEVLQKASLHFFQDLLHFLSPDERQEEDNKKLKGPFWLASISQNKHHITQPCPGTALNIIHSLILQNLDTFTNDEKYLNLLEKELFPQMLAMNRNPPTSTFVLPSASSAGNTGRWGSKSTGKGDIKGICLHPHSDSWKSMHYFTWILRWNQLSWTLLCVYYQKLPGICCDLIMEMLQNITNCVEGYRQSDVFDDGYIFVGIDSDIQSLQDIMSIVNKNKNKTYHQATKSPNDMVVSNTALWRCALSLETVYQLVTHHLDVLKHLEKTKDSSLISKVMSTIGEFTNIVTSFKGNILNAVAVAHIHQPIPSNNWEPICPMVQNHAIDIVKSFDDWDTVKVDESESNYNQQANQPSSSIFSSNRSTTQSTNQKTQALQLNLWDGSYTIPACDVGETVWVGLNCILSTCYVSSQKEFAASLSVLQHFLKRFAGSDVITKSILAGYINLANAIIPLKNDLQQKAILTSLCKTAIPSGIKSDQFCNFNNYHMNAFQSLIQIAHLNNKYLSKDDWYIILSTLEKISSYPSSRFPGVSKLYLRISTFTTSLSQESLDMFMDALINLSKDSTLKPNSPNTDTLVTMPSEQPSQQSIEIENQQKESSFGGKLISFAGRALLGASSSVVGGMTSSNENDAYVEESINNKPSRSDETFAKAFYTSVYEKLAQTKPNTEKEIFFSLSFSLVLLTDIIFENSFRFASFGESATNYLRTIASNCPHSEVRLFAIDSLSNLTSTGLTNVITKNGSDGSNNINFLPEVVASSKVLTMEDIFTVEIKVINDAEESKNKAAVEKLQKRHLSLLNTPHGQLLTPLCETITKTQHRDVAEAGLNALHVILEGNGHNLSGEAWSIIIDAISTLSGCETDSCNVDDYIDRSFLDWATCSSLAFRCLKLIVDDFLDELPSGDLSISTRAALLDCCAAFGSSQHDVNTSLTATGMLWTIADQNSSPSSLDHVLSKLAFLATDERVEVRNCSVNTLFSCLVGVGHNFTADQWRLCLNETIFGVLDQVISKGEVEVGGNDPENKKSNNTEEKKKSRYQVSVHHSRDSAIKQWATTQVLTLRGLERVLRQFFDTLLATTVQSPDATNSTGPSWFESGWVRILKQSFQYSTQIGGRETLEVRLAGVDLLILCVQLCSDDGVSAATTPARVGTNMKVVNGALRNVRSSNPIPASPSRFDRRNDISSKEKVNRHNLFLKSFEELMRFQEYLNDESKMQLERAIDSSIYIESPLLQVLTRLSQGLTKIYDCCKSNEMAPVSSSQTTASTADNNYYEIDYEGKMVDLICLVMIRASAGENGSRFLTQGQRISLDLLQQMASNSSSKALESLAEIGDVTLLCHSPSGPHSDSEVLEFEVAKVITKIYSLEGILHKSKVFVFDIMMDKIIASHNQHANIVQSDPLSETNAASTQEETKEDNNTNSFFSIFVGMFQGGLTAADFMEKNNQTDQFGDPALINTLLEEVWSKTTRFLRMILSNGQRENDPVNLSTDLILKFISTINENAPKRNYDDLGKAFLDGIFNSVNTLKKLTSSDDSQSKRYGDALVLFEACFQGLCKCSPDSEILQTTTEKLLSETLPSLTSRPVYEDKKVLTNEKIVIRVCKTLHQSQNVENTLICIFPHLTKLTTFDSFELRKEVGCALAKINISDIIKRLETAESNSNKADELNQRLTNDIKNYEVEIKQARNLKAKAEEAEELNSTLMREVERLKAKNDELERQVAVFSEGSAYT